MPTQQKPKLQDLESKFLDLVFQAAQQRAPYVWGGKGDRIWTPEGIRVNTFGISIAAGADVFDCSGLITTCLQRAGGPDLRFTHGAKQLLALCAEAAGDSSRQYQDELILRFYPGHVALKLCEASRSVAVLEAAGGDSTTLAPTPKGYVRCNRERRTDCLGEGSLSAYLAAWCAT